MMYMWIEQGFSIISGWTFQCCWKSTQAGAVYIYGILNRFDEVLCEYMYMCAMHSFDIRAETEVEAVRGSRWLCAVAGVCV